MIKFLEAIKFFMFCIVLGFIVAGFTVITHTLITEIKVECVWKVVDEDLMIYDYDSCEVVEQFDNDLEKAKFIKQAPYMRVVEGYVRDGEIITHYNRWENLLRRVR